MDRGRPRPPTSFEYTSKGELESITDAFGHSTRFQYDDLWRLTEDRVTGPDGTVEYRQEFQYDPVGNRLFDTLTDDVWKGRIAGYSYDERDRLVLRNGRPWEWDRGGRLLEEAGYYGWEIPGRSYEWDDDERLLSVEWTEHERLVAIDPGRLENVNDADGHRIESTEIQDGESKTTQYLVDESGWLSHVVAEIRDGEVVTHYQRAGDQLLRAPDRGGPPNSILRGGDVARGLNSGSKRAFVTDNQGRIIREITRDRVKVRVSNKAPDGKLFERFEKVGPPSAKDLELLKLLD